VRANARSPLEKPPIGAQSDRFQVRVFDRQEDGHRLSLVRDDHRAVRDFLGILSECCGRLRFFDDLHKSISSPPIRTRLRTLILMATIVTTFSGSDSIS